MDISGRNTINKGENIMEILKQYRIVINELSISELRDLLEKYDTWFKPITGKRDPSDVDERTKASITEWILDPNNQPVIEKNGLIDFLNYHLGDKILEKFA